MKESTRSRLEGYFGGDKAIGVSPLPLRVRNWLPHARAGDFSAQDKLPTPQPSVFGAPLPSLRHLSRDLIAYLFSTLPYQGSFCEPWDAPTVAVLISSKNRVRRLLPALHSNESNCENKKKTAPGSLFPRASTMKTLAISFSDHQWKSAHRPTIGLVDGAAENELNQRGPRYTMPGKH